MHEFIVRKPRGNRIARLAAGTKYRTAFRPARQGQQGADAAQYGGNYQRHADGVRPEGRGTGEGGGRRGTGGNFCIRNGLCLRGDLCLRQADRVGNRLLEHYLEDAFEDGRDKTGEGLFRVLRALDPLRQRVCGCGREVAECVRGETIHLLL